MVEQGGEYRAVPYALQCVQGRGLQQSPGLRIAEGGRTAFVAVRRAFHAGHWIAEYGIPFAEVVI